MLSTRKHQIFKYIFLNDTIIYMPFSMWALQFEKSNGSGKLSGLSTALSAILSFFWLNLREGCNKSAKINITTRNSNSRSCC